MRGIGFAARNMGLFWLRARRRKKDGWYYLAWTMQLVGPLAFVYVGIFSTDLRLQQQYLLLGIGAIGGTLYLLRDYLPWWPRSRTERVLDAALPPLPSTPGEVPTAGNPLLDPYQAASGTGRWRLDDGKPVAGELRWKVAPDPSVAQLRRATRIALRHTRRTLRTGQRIAVSATVRRTAGPDHVAVGFVLRGPGVGRDQSKAVADTFEAAFREALGEKFTVRRG